MFGQNTQVQLSFQRDYPDARDVRWIQTNDQWHATYRDSYDRNNDAYYDQYGRRWDTHTDWDRKDLPRNVDDRFNRRYRHDGEYRVVRIERPAYRPLFEIRFQSGTRDRTIYMNEQARRRRYHDRHD